MWNAGLDESQSEINIAGRDVNLTHADAHYYFMVNRWGNVETVSDFISLGSKVSVDGDWSHKIKRQLLLGRIAMTNLDSVLKSRDILC